MLTCCCALILVVMTILDPSLSKAVKEPHFVLTKAGRSHLSDQGVFDRRRRSASAPIVTRFHVISRVTSRYSKTQMISDVTNPASSAKEVSIELRLPKNAFISNFSMDIDSVTYVGVVKEKAAAKSQYQEAVARGESAALVSTKAREVQNFAVSVNVAAGNNVTFRLDYDELLIRKSGVYKQVIYADPGQVVDDFLIEVSVCEAIGITLIKASAPTEDLNNWFDNQENVDIRRSKTQALVKYQPSVQQQKAFRRSQNVIFSMTYDVVREEIGGEILIKDGYFVHFFAPPNLPVIPKNVIFIIDRSGSMWGTKMLQTKEALRAILNDLNDQDHFNIISFAGDIDVWKTNEMLPVNNQSKESAISYVNNIRAYGSTNLYGAASEGIRLLRLVGNNSTNSLDKASMLILLTDGQPTEGITNTAEIRNKVKAEINGSFSLFCLGFGADLDHNFLNKLAHENKGISRRIYEDSDAALQLKGFYDEVASPLLLHVVMKYQGRDTRKLTKIRFDNHFDGSEILVVGQVLPSSIDSSPASLRGVAEAQSATGDVTMESMAREVEECPAHDGFDMRKVWAFFTIKNLLAKKSHISKQSHLTHIEEKILKLSLKYNFVTPLTSMVVTKPNVSDNVIAGSNLPIHKPQQITRPIFSGGVVPMARFSPQYQMPKLAASLRRIKLGSHKSRGFHRGLSFGLQLLSHGPRPRTTTTTQRPTTSTTTPLPAPTSTSTTNSSTPMTTTPFVNPIPPNPLELTSSCRKDVTFSLTTNITSPGFPGFYQPNLQCVWQIGVDTDLNNTKDSKIKITFSKLDLESGSCNRDRILVYPDFDPSAASTSPKSLCGYENNNNSFNASQNFVLVFQSDAVVSGRGFLAELNVVN